MKKVLFFILFPMLSFGQHTNDNPPKKTTNNSQKNSASLYQQTISKSIEKAAEHNRRSGHDLVNTFKIAFGSCGHQNNKLPIFNNVVNHQPDLFIFLGDNIYGDTKDMKELKEKYDLLGNKPSYKNLKNNVPIIATWDDHDYGWNDIGKNYKFKEESKEIFLDFFNVPENSPRRNHDGIYGSRNYKTSYVDIQIILLDERTFRDDLIKYNGDFKDDNRYSFYNQAYSPNNDINATILGKDQWVWLENELRKPYDLRIICSATQFGIEWNGYESWANFPNEKQKMLDLIEETKAKGVLFISGDVHYSEISKIETESYPIYDFTSSGLSSTWKFATPNKNRIEGPIMENNFGLITVEGDNNKTSVSLETWDINDNQRIEYSFSLKDIGNQSK